MNYIDFVFVTDKDSLPCNPINEGYAGKLLRTGKAKIVNHDPLVIKRLDDYSSKNENRHTITLKVDTGFGNIGFSASDDKHEYIAGQVELLSGISDRLVTKKGYRTQRRSRLRYRRNKNIDYKTVNNPTYKNGNKDGWLAPSVIHKIESHVRVIDRIASWIPIDKVIIETANFDIQKIKATLNGTAINGIDYQKGEMYGFENAKQYVRERDNYTCQICKEKLTDKRHVIIEVHHIIPRSKGGSNKPDNMISLCHCCHKKVHENNNDNKLFRELRQRKIINTYKDATFMNTMRWELYNRLKENYDVSMSFGYITRMNRKNAGLEKYHYTDAVCISEYHKITLTKNIYLVEQKRCNDRCMESFFDAKYIDSRDGKVKKGSELCKSRVATASSKRSTKKEDIDNKRIYRQEKVSKGKRRYENHSYCLKPGDLIYINYGNHKGNIAEVTTMQKNPNGTYKIVFSYANPKCKIPSINIKEKEYVELTHNQCEKIKIVRTRRGMIWRKVNRLEFEENTTEQIDRKVKK